MLNQAVAPLRRARFTQKKGRGARLSLLALVCLPLILGGGCEAESLREAKKLSYPRDMEFVAVYIDQDKDWKVTLWEGDGLAPKDYALKPGGRRTQIFRLHFDRPFEIRTLTFSAQAQGRLQISETLQIRPADPCRRGVVFSRTAEGDPDIFWLTNPD